MSKDMKRELRKLRLKHDLIEKTDCTPEENSAFSEIKAKGETLPENVFEYLGDDGTGNGTFYKVSDTGLTDAEKEEQTTVSERLTKLLTFDENAPTLWDLRTKVIDAAYKYCG